MQCFVLVILCYVTVIDCQIHNVKQTFPKDPHGSLSKWYSKWLTHKNRSLSSGYVQREKTFDRNIQADGAGCRDDLCIEDDLDPDYFDDRNLADVSTLDPVSIGCPDGFEPIVRDGIIYCDIIRESTTADRPAVPSTDPIPSDPKSRPFRPLLDNIRITDHPQDGCFTRNEPATLNCKAEGNPPPKITWYKDGKLVETSKENPGSHRVLLPNGQLFFLRVINSKNGYSDVGQYYCKATNKHGSAVSDTAYIQIADADGLCLYSTKSTTSLTEQSTLTTRSAETTLTTKITRPTKSMRPTKTTQAANTTRPTRITQPAKSTQPIKSRLPAKTGQATSNTQPTQNVSEMQSTKAIDNADPTYTSQSRETTEHSQSRPTTGFPLSTVRPLQSKESTKTIKATKTSRSIGTPPATETTPVPKTTQSTKTTQPTKTSEPRMATLSTDSSQAIETLPVPKTIQLTKATQPPKTTQQTKTITQTTKTSWVTKPKQATKTTLTAYTSQQTKQTHSTKTKPSTQITQKMKSTISTKTRDPQDMFPKAVTEYITSSSSSVSEDAVLTKAENDKINTLTEHENKAYTSLPQGPFGISVLPFPSLGNVNKNRINTKKGHINSDKNVIAFPGIDPKLDPCKDGKVLAGTLEGYRCMEPVFPDGVCPPGRVPQISSAGLQCVPCPYGQHTVKVDGGVKCMVTTQQKFPIGHEEGIISSNLLPTINSEAKCPEGMQAYQTSAGRICRYIPQQTTETQESLCPDGQISILVDNRVECKDIQNVCPQGRVPITIETGETICAFDMVKNKGSSEDETINICPPGLEPVTQPSGDISCQYVMDKTTETSSRKTSVCGHQEILTHDTNRFVCQSIEKNLEKALPDCAGDMILVRLGEFYDCITEYEANLICDGNEELTRDEGGFVCKKLWDGSVQKLCSSNQVFTTDENGHVTCISLHEADEQCGQGLFAVKYGDSFICREKKLDIQCPEGYKFKLVKATSVCVSVEGPECVDIDGTVSELCLTDQDSLDLPELDPDFVFESDNTCPEGQVATIIDGKQICVDERDLELNENMPCEEDGVRPCDLDLDILLQGCNPECANGGTCIEGKCVCPDGITGIACNEDVDECSNPQTSNCSYRCVNTFGGYQCSCPPDKILGADGHNCEGEGCIPECLNGGQCIRGTCQCPEGFGGGYCQTDVNECNTYGERLCQHYCRNTYGGYECVCPPGSKLNTDRRTCTNTTCIPACRNGGSCLDHRCFCQPGFYGFVYTTCVPACRNGGSCLDHKCYCPPGFYGFVCQLDLNECYRNNPCQHDCINTWGSYRCSCKHGYRLDIDGHSCF